MTSVAHRKELMATQPDDSASMSVTLGSHWLGSVCGWYDITYRVIGLYERKDGIWARLRPVKGMRHEDSDDIHRHIRTVSGMMTPVAAP